MKKQQKAPTPKSRMKSIIRCLAKEYPDVRIQLHYEHPHQLLVATILSAQCTDARVNIVTGKLFGKYKAAVDYINVPAEELEQDIFSTGFYRAKARNIRAATKMVLEQYGGEVPGTMEELLRLPGVGRKTANVLLGHCFDTPGIVVDTHVIRISNRLGFAATKDPQKIEFILMELVPKKQWVGFTHYLINHGRKVCTARRAKCDECSIGSYCESAFVI